jgi:ferredoxin
MAYVIAEPCIGVKDTACLDVCPVDCIRPVKDGSDFIGVPQLYIHPVDCIDCAACVPVCPVSAIYLAEELPAQWQHFAQANADWFEARSAENVTDLQNR